MVKKKNNKILLNQFINNIFKINNKNLTISQMIRSNILILQFGLEKKKNF